MIYLRLKLTLKLTLGVMPKDYCLFGNSIVVAWVYFVMVDDIVFMWYWWLHRVGCFNGCGEIETVTKKHLIA
jgi:hypothetical protein